MNEISTTVKRYLSEIKAMHKQREDQTSPEAPEAESLGADFWCSAVSSCRLEDTLELRVDSLMNRSTSI